MHGASGSESDPIAVMNVIPFIDICLVLLIIVLVTASMSAELMAFIQPQATEEKPMTFIESKETVSLTVKGDGKCVINEMPIDVKDLKAEAAKSPDLPFVLHAAKDVKAEHIVAAVAQLRAAKPTMRLLFSSPDQGSLPPDSTSTK